MRACDGVNVLILGCFPAGGGPGKGGTATRFIDGEKTGKGDIGATLTFVFSADYRCDDGKDSRAQESPDYPAGNNRFNGEIKGIQLWIAEVAEEVDHYIEPEKAMAMAMARQ